MASVQAIVKVLPNYLKQRNFGEMFAMVLIQQIYNMITWPSRRKLLHYNLLLAQERLHKMESALGSSSPYSFRGQKINKLR